MALKPFTIQGADLTIGGVNLQAGNTGVVIPGVTRATSYKVEDVEDVGDQNIQWDPQLPIYILDNAELTRLYGDSRSGVYVAATYSAELDDEGYIDNIQVNDNGSFDSTDKTALEQTSLIATQVTDPINNFNINDWQTIPFVAVLKAGEIETIGGGGANTGDLVFDTNTMYAVDGEDPTGFINLDNGSEASIGTNNDMPLRISLYQNSSSKNWLFDTTGNITFPDGSVQSTAYTGQGGGGSGTGTFTTLPDFLTYIPNTPLNAGQNSQGIFFSGDTSDQVSYPIRTNFEINSDFKTVVTLDMVVNDEGADFGIAVFGASVDPVWRWDPDTSRIAVQYNGFDPEIDSQYQTVNAGDSLPDTGTYTVRFTYDPLNSPNILFETLDNQGTVISTVGMDETLPSGSYRIGFAADQDSDNLRTYIKNLLIEITDNGNPFISYTNSLLLGGAGGNANTGNILFEGTGIHNDGDGNDSVDIYTNNGPDYSEVWLRHNQDVLITADGEGTAWSFQANGNLLLPNVAKINSGGFGVTNSAEIGTDVSFGLPNVIWWDNTRKGRYINIDAEDRAYTVYADPEMALNDYPILSTRGIDTGEKYIFSFYINNIQYNTGNTGVGIATHETSLEHYLGYDNTSICLYDTGAVWMGNTQIATVEYYLGGDTIDVVVNRDENLIWFRKNNGYWNNDPDQEPETNTGGIDISIITAAVYPAVSLAGTPTGDPGQPASLWPLDSPPYNTPVGYNVLAPIDPGGEVIRNSEIYVSAGTGETRIIVDSFGNSLAYFGVENVGLPGFAGMVASDPDVTSMYQVASDIGGNILLGATQQEGELKSNEYSAAFGVLNNNLNINGVYSNTAGVVISGGNANNSSAIVVTETGIGVNNTIYPKNTQSIDIGTRESTFDSIYVASVKGKNHLLLDTTNQDYSYWYNVYGDLHNDNNDEFGASVDYDSDGNLYVLGKYFNPDNGNLDTLALKYSPDGNLLWRKSWVDENGDFCGTSNDEFYIRNDNLYWISSTALSDSNAHVYVGKMDLDGVIVDPATQIGTGVLVNDMYVDSSGYVYIAGARTNGIEFSPWVAKVDTSNNEVVWTMWFNDYYGNFNSITIDENGLGFIFLVGTMNDGGEYAIITTISTDGEYADTFKLNSNEYGVGVAVTCRDAYTLYTTYRRNDGGIVLSKFYTNDLSTTRWSRVIGLNNYDFYPKDLLVDDNGSCYVVGTFSSSNDFYIGKFNSDGQKFWERGFGDWNGKSDGTGPGNYSRMAALYGNNRLAFTGYTSTDPINNDSETQSTSVITVQIPIDGSCLAQYGQFWLYETNSYFDWYDNSVSISQWSMTTIDTDIEGITYSNNSGFVPNTLLMNPAYFPFRGEIRGPLDSSWQFDSEGNMRLPGDGRIYGDSSSGAIYITAGDKGRFNNDYYGEINLEDSSGRSRINLNQNEVRLTHNGYDFRFIRDNKNSTSVIQEEGYSNFTITKLATVVQSSDVNKVVWIARDAYVASGKFNIQVQIGTNGGSDYDTMSCDVVLAARRLNNVNISARVSVYGLVYTTDNPLVTFNATVMPGGTYTVTHGNSGTWTEVGSGTSAEFVIVAHENYSYYSVDNINTGGSGYKIGDIIGIYGNVLGGLTYENAMQIEVTNVDSSGSITGTTILESTCAAGKVAITCTPNGLSEDCYVKVRGTETGSGYNENWC